MLHLLARETHFLSRELPAERESLKNIGAEKCGKPRRRAFLVSSCAAHFLHVSETLQLFYRRHRSAKTSEIAVCAVTCTGKVTGRWRSGWSDTKTPKCNKLFQQTSIPLFCTISLRHKFRLESCFAVINDHGCKHVACTRRFCLFLINPGYL